MNQYINTHIKWNKDKLLSSFVFKYFILLLSFIYLFILLQNEISQYRFVFKANV